ncbi:MAG: hypothetical protein R3B98_08155 [Hyphomonas sp.]
MKRMMAMVVLLASLGACATPRAYNLIDEGARPALKTVDSILIVTSSEIETQIAGSNVSTAMGGGLLGAVIDAGVEQAQANKAAELIVPIRDKLLDFDFGAQLESDLETELAAAGIEGMADVSLVRAIEKDFKENRVGASKADAVLFLTSSYAVTFDFSALSVSASAEMYPVNAALDAYKEKPNSDARKTDSKDNIYRNHFAETLQVASAGNKEANANALAETSSEELVAKLKEGSRRIAKKIAEDLQKIDDVPNK